MTVAIFYCGNCQGENQFTHANGLPRLYPKDDDVCVVCGASGKWRTEPLVVWDLNLNDQRFLRSLRIAAE